MYVFRGYTKTINPLNAKLNPICLLLALLRDHHILHVSRVRVKVRKSLHHHAIQISQPTRCNDFSSLFLDVYYGSTCFGRPHAHHQELNICSSSLWFYSWSVEVAVLLLVVGLARPRATALLSPLSDGKTRGCY